MGSRVIAALTGAVFALFATLAVVRSSTAVLVPQAGALTLLAWLPAAGCALGGMSMGRDIVGAPELGAPRILKLIFRVALFTYGIFSGVVATLYIVPGPGGRGFYMSLALKMVMAVVVAMASGIVAPSRPLASICPVQAENADGRPGGRA